MVASGASTSQFTATSDLGYDGAGQLVGRRLVWLTGNNAQSEHRITAWSGANVVTIDPAAGSIPVATETFRVTK